MNGKLGNNIHNITHTAKLIFLLCRYVKASIWFSSKYRFFQFLRSPDKHFKWVTLNFFHIKISIVTGILFTFTHLADWIYLDYIYLVYKTELLKVTGRAQVPNSGGLSVQGFKLATFWSNIQCLNHWAFLRNKDNHLDHISYPRINAHGPAVTYPLHRSIHVIIVLCALFWIEIQLLWLKFF